MDFGGAMNPAGNANVDLMSWCVHLGLFLFFCHVSVFVLSYTLYSLSFLLTPLFSLFLAPLLLAAASTNNTQQYTKH
jgi:hypothetical protein